MTSDIILLVGHGSREPCGNAEIVAFAQAWRARWPNWLIELCFLELADVNLDAGLSAAAAKSQRVIVLPLLLSAAGHAKRDIPQAVARAQLRFAHTQFVCTPPLLACEPLLKLLLRRYQGALLALGQPDLARTGVVLLARGSSDAQANAELLKMANWLRQASQAPLVDAAFTSLASPTLEQAVQRQLQLGMQQVAVLPYYLFNGTLIKRITTQLTKLQQQYPKIGFTLMPYLGFEPEIFELLEQRVLDARAGFGVA